MAVGGCRPLHVAVSLPAVRFEGVPSSTSFVGGLAGEPVPQCPPAMRAYAVFSSMQTPHAYAGGGPPQPKALLLTGDDVVHPNDARLVPSGRLAWYDPSLLQTNLDVGIFISSLAFLVPNNERERARCPEEHSLEEKQH
jgi:hypothetical protein